MKIMVTSFKRSLRALLHSVPPTLQQATATHASPGHSWASLSQSLVGHCSLLLGPGVHKFLFVPPGVYFPSPV